MSERAASPQLDLAGAAAPPRRNGELVFAAPWQSRLFGVTLALCQSGLFEWEEFRRLLISEIAAWEAAGDPAHEWSYYERWQAALERLLVSQGLCARADLDSRVVALASRAPGHDH
jgi:nitrile hydratase accessory protein